MQTPGRAFPDLAALTVAELRTLARHLCVRQYLRLNAQELRREIETNVRQDPPLSTVSTSADNAGS
jgi:hypothetical protein